MMALWKAASKTRCREMTQKLVFARPSAQLQRRNGRTLPREFLTAWASQGREAKASRALPKPLSNPFAWHITIIATTTQIWGILKSTLLYHESFCQHYL